MNLLQRYRSFAVAAFLFCCAAPADLSAQPETIRAILEEYYPAGQLYIGAASHPWKFGRTSGVILDREFSYSTPTNDFKQTVVHPEPGVWSWERPDSWITHSLEHGQLVRMHCPVSPQCSPWAKQDDRTTEELSLMLDEYMTAVCCRYNGVDPVRWMDVVNETVVTSPIKDELGNMEPGDWFGPRAGVDRWENPWTRLGFDSSTSIGLPVYIDRAFEIANREAPDILQIINQHGALEEVVWKKMKLIVDCLREEKGRRVDGLGWQAHIETGWEKIPGNLQRLSEIIDWCQANGLEFHVTEMNVWLKEAGSTDYEAQADTYTAILEILTDKSRNGVVGLNFWGVTDDDLLKPEWQGTLWSSEGVPRPAYYRIRKMLLDKAGD